MTPTQTKLFSLWRFVAFFALCLGLLHVSRAQEEQKTTASTGSKANSEQPKLVILVVIDQLRGDMPSRYYDRFEAGGFRYFFERGIWYQAALHPHAHTETVVGHTTLATGAYPSRHGMIGNAWIDGKSGALQDSVADARWKIVGTTTTGASPFQIETTTTSDELAITTAGQSRSFAVSGKNRAAIPLAGHTGKAFWYSDEAEGFDPSTYGQFVSSTYYYPDQLPDWAAAWNGQKRAAALQNQAWNPLWPRDTYLYAKEKPFAQAVADYGVTFPHPFGTYDPKANTFFYTKLAVSPVGDELTMSFATQLIASEHLGQNGVTDFLGISLSSNDLVGHFFSNTSMEAEDVLLRVDRVLAGLMSFVERQPGLGLANTLVIVTGDHGIPEVPEYLEQLHINTGRVKLSNIQAAAQQALATRFHRDDLLLPAQVPYLYLNHGTIQNAGLDELEVERAAAAAVMKADGVALAVPCTELALGGKELDSELISAIQRNEFPGRSGDVYIVPSPQWQLEEPPASGEVGVIVDHGSPWDYDRYVPIFFAGGHVQPAVVSRPVSTTDIAATLAVLLHTKFPSGCAGTPLPEVLTSSPGSREHEH